MDLGMFQEIIAGRSPFLSFSVPYRRSKLCSKLCRRIFLVTLGCSGRAHAATVSSHHTRSRLDQS